MDGNKRPGRPSQAESAERDREKAESRCEVRPVSLPIRLWRWLEELKRKRMDPSLSATVRTILVDKRSETEKTK